MTNNKNDLLYPYTLQNMQPNRIVSDGYASSLPPNLSQQFGQFASPYLESIASIFPPSNPYGQAVKNFLLGEAPQAAQKMAEGEPYVLFDTRAGRQLIKPAALDMAGALPTGAAIKTAGAGAKILAPAAKAVGASAKLESLKNGSLLGATIGSTHLDFWKKYEEELLRKVEHAYREFQEGRAPFSKFSELQNKLFDATELRQHVEQQRNAIATPRTPNWAPENQPPRTQNYADKNWWEQNVPSQKNVLIEELRNSPNVFAYGVPPKNMTKAEDLADFYSKSSGVQLDAVWRGNDLHIETPNGYLKIVNANSDSPYISSIALNSENKQNGGGKLAYQAAYSWLAANGKKASADPAGITAINELRKAGNVLSAQLKTGQQVADVNFMRLPKNARESQIIEAEEKKVSKLAPETKRITLTDEGFHLDGKLSNPSEIQSFLVTSGAVGKGIGQMTAMRAALVRFAKSGGDVKKIIKKLPPFLAGIAGLAIINKARDNTQENL